MDHATLTLFGWACAVAGGVAVRLALLIEKRITERRELQASCDHTWGDPSYIGAYPTRHCKWCRRQQAYRGTKEEGHWEDW